jgi:hypothetical protein
VAAVWEASSRAGTRSRAGIGRRLAIAASVLAHVLVFALLIHNAGTPPRFTNPPPMNVVLMRPWTARLPPRSAKPPPQTPPRAAAPDRAHPTPEFPPPPFTAPPIPQAPPGEDNGDGVRSVLKGLLGCDHIPLAGQSKGERQDCLNRIAERQGAGLGDTAALSLHGVGAYAAPKDPTPYLNRRPKNGCKPRAAGDQTPDGREGAVGGVDCAWSF